MKKIFLVLFILAFVSCNDDETIPTCADPTNLLVEDLGTTTVTLTWDEVDATDWKIEYGTAGFTQGTGTIVNTATDVITIENLLENTTYDAYLQATCANGPESNWVSFPSFTTLYDCIAPSNIEITDIQNTTATLTWDAANFSEEVEIEYGETGFTQGNGTIISTTDNFITFQNLSENTAYDFYLRTKCANQSFSDWTSIQTISTTLICNTPNNIQITDIQNTAATITWDTPNFTEEVEVEYGETGFTQGNGTVISTTENFITFQNLSENTAYDFYLRTKCVDDSFSDWTSIQTFTTTLTCNTPTNIQITDIQNTTTTLTWDAANFSEEVEVEYGETGFTQGNGTVISTTDNFITFQNLSENTVYDFYLRTKCVDDSFSDWTNIQTFTTTLICTTPNNIQATYVSDTSTTITWTAANFTQEVEIEYGTNGFTQGSGTIVSTTDSFITIQGLSSYSTYDFYLRTKCVDDNFSNWTTTQTFSTNNCQGNYNGSITLLTQQDVDNFSYETITQGSLYIGDINGAPSDIHDLSPLNCLTQTTYLYIDNNPNLQTLNGLENLNAVGWGLYIRNNASLLNLDAINNLVTSSLDRDYWATNPITFEIQNNPSLTQIHLPNLTYAGSVKINDCPNLTSIEMPLVERLFNLRIYNNPQINNLNFTNLERLGGVALGGNFGSFIVGDTQLTNLNMFTNLTSSIAGVIIRNNQLLQNLNGLSNCIISGEISGLGIINNDLLTDLSGINFSNNPSCASISIQDNDALSDISALSVLDCIRSLTIRNNDLLTNLDAFQNLSACLLGDVKIENNSTLSNFCGPASFLSGLTPPECFLTISGNLFNPTQQDLMDGNCSQ